MEAAAAAAFGRPRSVVKIEKLAGDGVGDGDSPSKQRLRVMMGNNYGKQEYETDQDKTRTSSDDQKDLCCTKNIQEDELESARAEMGEVREENQRLKRSLSQMMKDYEALRMQFMDIVGREANKLPEKPDDTSNNEKHDDDQNQTAETELVSLTLGRSPATEKNKKVTDEKSIDVKESLSLGLNRKFECELTTVKETDSPNRSVANSFDNESKEEAGDTSWPPSKGAKTMRNGDDDDDVAHQNPPPKRARVCVRARCETPTMNDGCQWRKYGQKIAKGNPCPRAYYRCTGSPTCPVRKQVQRCVDDMSILITTYEGTHNHQLPVSASAMASTTSAAASMLLSGSSTTTAAVNLNPNFYLSNNSSIIPSTSQTNPTITLDLTSNPSTSSNSTTHFGKFPTTTFTNSRYPFTNHLDFGSSRNNVLSWNNDSLSYNNRNNNPTTANNIYQQSYFQQQQQQNNNLTHHNVAYPSTSFPHQLQPLPDTMAAATKAITADPSFQSALVAALTSIIGTGNVIKPSMRGESSLFQLTSTTATSKGNGCGTSFLSNIATVTGTGTTSTSTTTGNMVFVSGSSLPFSNPKSASTSPGDHIDLTN